MVRRTKHGSRNDARSIGPTSAHIVGSKKFFKLIMLTSYRSSLLRAFYSLTP